MEQKSNVIRRFTKSAAKITCLFERAFAILIQELADDNIGTAGRTLREIKDGSDS